MKIIIGVILSCIPLLAQTQGGGVECTNKDTVFVACDIAGTINSFNVTRQDLFSIVSSSFRSIGKFCYHILNNSGYDELLLVSYVEIEGTYIISVSLSRFIYYYVKGAQHYMWHATYNDSKVFSISDKRAITDQVKTMIDKLVVEYIKQNGVAYEN